MALAVHVAKRLLLVLAGYLVGLVVALVAGVAIYGVLASIPDSPDYFDLVAVSWVAALVVPPVGMVIYLVAIVVTFVQTLVTALITEVFALRQFWLHMLFGALVGASGFALLWQDEPQDLDPARWTDLGVIAAAGLVGGLVYWLIAGRDAGLNPAARAVAI